MNEQRHLSEMDHATYQMRVEERLDPSYSDWFGGFTVSHLENGGTLLTGVVPDQAALYGVVTRCRDLGLTLVSINPVAPPARKNPEELERKLIMKSMYVETSKIIDASPDAVYEIISDYRVKHPAILSRPYFTELTVEKGGFGAGTVVMTRLEMFGQKASYHQIVSEPEPGHKLVESDLDSDQYTIFTFDPVNGGKQTRMTIASDFPLKPGFEGFLTRLMQPPVIRWLYNKELQNINDYVRQNKLVAVPR